MGKKLIIKGADFSVNSILDSINITELITTFVDGINGISGTNRADRKAIYPRFSISQYRQSGHPLISVNVKSLGCLPFVTSIGPTGSASGDPDAVIQFDNSQTYLSKGVYTLNLDDLDPNQSFIYFSINIDKTQADVSSDNLSDYIEIKMSEL